MSDPSTSRDRAPKGKAAARGTATATVRDELAHVGPGRLCDRRAEAAALLRSVGSIHLAPGRLVAVEVEVERAAAARRALGLLQGLAGRGIGVLLHEPGRGRPRARFAIRAPGVPVERLVAGGVLDPGGRPPRGIPREMTGRRCCRAAYLRGAFLARGSVSAPRSAAHLEIRAPDRETASGIARLLGSAGARASVRRHRGMWTAYAKDVASVGAALAFMGAHRAALAWEEGLVWKSVRAQAARLANADAANAGRIARAAVAQRAAIEAIEEGPGLASLVPGLREAARLRLAHPQASLEELGRLCRPPVSKGAVAGRMRKLERLALAFRA
ncbi:MAG: DNA-binding protein WhiA [Acidobacteria bacterium]|nr:DNA-binding protein WhiA [Acidobacteriota bacterium]